MPPKVTRAILAILTLVVFGCDAPVPDDLGPRDGTLAPCPETPNCVHTGHRHPEGTRALHLHPDVSGERALAGIREVVESMPRTTVVEQRDGYLHAEARSLVFRFVDDLELLLAADGEVVVRSASRLGRNDLGVNARRVEALRERLSEAGLIR